MFVETSRRRQGENTSYSLLCGLDPLAFLAFPACSSKLHSYNLMIISSASICNVKSCVCLFHGYMFYCCSGVAEELPRPANTPRQLPVQVSSVTKPPGVQVFRYGDPTVPCGWGTRMVSTGAGRCRKIYKSPCGRVFYSRRMAKRFLQMFPYPDSDGDSDGVTENMNIRGGWKQELKLLGGSDNNNHVHKMDHDYCLVQSVRAADGDDQGPGGVTEGSQPPLPPHAVQGADPAAGSPHPGQRHGGHHGEPDGRGDPQLLRQQRHHHGHQDPGRQGGRVQALRVHEPQEAGEVRREEDPHLVPTPPVSPGRSTSRTTTRRRFECRNCSLPTFSTESSRDRHERYHCRELNAKVILRYVQWHIQQLIMSMTLTRSRSSSEYEPHFTEAAF